MHKRLTTTVEEDATARDNFAALAERRERAAAEKLQLEHKLKLQRLEMAKQMGALQVGRQGPAVSRCACIHQRHGSCSSCLCACIASAAQAAATEDGLADGGAAGAQGPLQEPAVLVVYVPLTGRGKGDTDVVCVLALHQC
jgi:hypothetical protein